MSTRRTFHLESLLLRPRDRAAWGRDYRLEVTVAGEQLGDGAAAFRPRNVAHELNWVVEREIPDDSDTVEVVAVLRAVDTTVASTARLIMRRPFADCRYELATDTFEIDLHVQGPNRRAPGDEVFVCRESEEASGPATTVRTVPRVHVELNPITPTPSRFGPDNERLPPLPRWVLSTNKWTNPSLGWPSGRAVQPNEIQNPAVIPILERCTPGSAARFAVSAYWPAALNIGRNDARFSWTAEPAGLVEFLGAPAGTEVMVYGMQRGEVALVVSMHGRELGRIRALVEPLVRVPFRVTVMRQRRPHGRSAVSTADDVMRHIGRANQILRQVAVELVPDGDREARDGTARLRDGVFERLDEGTEHVVGVQTYSNTAIINSRPWVVNLVYVHTLSIPNLGVAPYFPDHPGGSSMTDRGTPSSSWRLPSGVSPDDPARPVTQPILNGYTRDQHVSAFISEWEGVDWDPPSDGSSGLIDEWLQRSPENDPSFGRTIAHEVGHTMNLMHRGGTSDPAIDDGVGHPRFGNLMSAPRNRMHHPYDIDLVQARICRGSALVQHWLR